MGVERTLGRRSVMPREPGSQLPPCSYNSLSILPAALGKPVRDVAAKVCDCLGLVVVVGHSVDSLGVPSRADWATPSLQAKAVGIQGNLSGDLLQSGGLLVVSKGGPGGRVWWMSLNLSPAVHGILVPPQYGPALWLSWSVCLKPWHSGTP